MGGKKTRSSLRAPSPAPWKTATELIGVARTYIFSSREAHSVNIVLCRLNSELYKNALSLFFPAATYNALRIPYFNFKVSNLQIL